MESVSKRYPHPYSSTTEKTSRLLLWWNRNKHDGCRRHPWQIVRMHAQCERRYLRVWVKNAPSKCQYLLYLERVLLESPPRFTKIVIPSHRSFQNKKYDGSVHNQTHEIPKQSWRPNRSLCSPDRCESKSLVVVIVLWCPTVITHTSIPQSERYYQFQDVMEDLFLFWWTISINALFNRD